MRCDYACGSADHQMARRRFLGGIGAGIGASLGWGGFERMILPAATGQLQSQQKRVLVLFLSGGSSQLETWDPKPGTITGGPFRAIPTTVPGTHVCELLPHTAQQMHHLALIRSINTNENEHGRGRRMMETGRPNSPATDHPHLGAVVSKALSMEDSPLPGHIHVSPSGGGSRRNDSAYLGPKYGSIVIGADGKGLRNSELPKSITDDSDRRRHEFRRRQNDHFYRRRRTAEMDAYTQTYEQAIQLMNRREVFDISKENTKAQEKYGDHPLGRQCLMARRLLENGITFVQVSHSNYDTQQREL